MYRHLSKRVRDKRISNIMCDGSKLRKCKSILKWRERECSSCHTLGLNCGCISISSQHMFHKYYKWWLNLNYKRICLANRIHTNIRIVFLYYTSKNLLNIHDSAHTQAQYIMQIPFKKTGRSCVMEIKNHLDLKLLTTRWEGHAFQRAVLFISRHQLPLKSHTAYLRSVWFRITIIL